MKIDLVNKNTVVVIFDSVEDASFSSDVKNYNQIVNVIKEGHNKIVFEIKTDYIEDPLFHNMVNAWKLVASTVGGKVVYVADKKFREIMHLFGLDKVFTSYETVDDALKSFEDDL